MPDWQKLVRERLGSLGLSPKREEEIRAELAEHLEDESRGANNPAPVRIDWSSLACEIRQAEEDEMSHTAKTLWVPGTTTLIGAALLLLVMARAVPPAAWIEGNGSVVLLAIWILAYISFGGVGAYWSRQAGGDMRARLLSGIFPVVLHLAIFVLPVVATFVLGKTNFPEHRQAGYLAWVGVMWILIPGIVLALGTLPFLRGGARTSPATKGSQRMSISGA